MTSRLPKSAVQASDAPSRGVARPFPDRAESRAAQVPAGAEHPRWSFDAGYEFAPGRHALKRLGGGHRYDAYLAWDDRLHTVTVAKLVRPHLVDDSNVLDDMLMEAATLRRLGHPVVVRAFDVIADGPHPHLLLEHLEGPRLSTLLRKYGPLPPEQLVPLAVQICAALHYLAREEIVHLDVKPSNIIMGAPPRLIDLSVAETVAGAAALRGPVGTDAYMAPEQCAPRTLGPVGSPADVWGLGVTLYRAATGERPFSGPGHERDPDERRWPQLIEEPRPLDGRVPGALADPILDCLARSPADRPSPADVSAAIEPMLEALPRPRLSRIKPRLG
jgi:serine/threonine protein kinase